MTQTRIPRPQMTTTTQTSSERLERINRLIESDVKFNHIIGVLEIAQEGGTDMDYIWAAKFLIDRYLPTA